MHRMTLVPAYQGEKNGGEGEGFTTATQILDESHGFQRLH